MNGYGQLAQVIEPPGDSQDRQSFSKLFQAYLNETNLLGDVILEQQKGCLKLTSYSEYSLQLVHKLLVEDTYDERSALGQYIDKPEEKEQDNMRQDLIGAEIQIDKTQKPWHYTYSLSVCVVDVLKRVLIEHFNAVSDARNEQPSVTQIQGSFYHSSLTERSREHHDRYKENRYSM